MVIEMIDTEKFYECLLQNGFDFFTGVPDSLLKDLCACLSDKAGKNYVIAANEGNAVGIASGHYLGNGHPAVVFMQNSGIGNAVNPLLSLADKAVYGIPMLLIVGWRGEPGVHDEPQHIKQGEVTLELFEAMGIETVILGDDYEKTISECAEKMLKTECITALIIRKNTFSEYRYIPEKSDHKLTREQALRAAVSCLGDDDIIISTTGKTSRELYELREADNSGHANDFLTVGSMGHASSIALGLSLSSDKNIYCIDGDGAFLMHMGANAVNAQTAGDNFKYIVINNGAHESVGGQKTVGFEISMKTILKGCGFEVCEAYDGDGIRSGMSLLSHKKAAMIIYTKQGSRSDLGRPSLSPAENKKRIMENLK